MGAVMNLLLIIFGVSVGVVWIISLVNWDGNVTWTVPSASMNALKKKNQDYMQTCLLETQ